MQINPNQDQIHPHLQTYATTLKKLHDRCEFLYSRVENAVKNVLKNHPQVQEEWENRLVALLNEEHQLFQSLRSAQGLEALEENVAYLLHQLQKTADALPKNDQPKLGTTNNRTINDLAKETFHLGRHLSPEELQRAYLEEFEQSSTEPFAQLGPDAQSHLAHYLEFSDIRTLAQTSRFDATLAGTLKAKKIIKEISQAFKNRTLSEVLQLLHTLTQSKRDTIKVLDLSEVGFREGSSPGNELIAILELCPHLSDVRLDENFNLSQKEVEVLLSNDQIEKLHLLGCTIEQIPIEQLSRITGIQLKSETDQELQTQIDQLIEHAPNLTALHIHSSNITQIQRLPFNLTDLSVKDCQQLQELPELPQSLRSFDFSSCSNLTLPTFPESLRVLRCGSIARMTTLPSLPALLEMLEVRFAKNLGEVSNLPKSLRVADFSYCKNLQRIQHLPPGLKSLRIDDCNALLKLPEFSEGLLHLSISSLNLAELPPVPDSLLKLEASFCRNLVSISDLPSELQEFYCDDCTALEEIVILPPNLKALNCSSTALKSLPPLPDHMAWLNCSFNKKLRTLPPLPLSMQSLDVRQSKIYQLPPIPPGCEVRGA